MAEQIADLPGLRLLALISYTLFGNRCRQVIRQGSVIAVLGNYVALFIHFYLYRFLCAR